MMRYQWNTLRVGDSVLVHTDEGRLVAAIVATVAEDETGPDAEHAIGIRVDANDESYEAWPSLADVHSDPMEITESCVHCRVIRALDVTPAEVGR